MDEKVKQRRKRKEIHAQETPSGGKKTPKFLRKFTKLKKKVFKIFAAVVVKRRHGRVKEPSRTVKPSLVRRPRLALLAILVVLLGAVAVILYRYQGSSVVVIQENPAATEVRQMMNEIIQQQQSGGQVP